ncbi:hypothetical protein PTSG_11137 [Salpingoeca rosetta]|uniref:Uncharacterized protein n=1 Tax=Salpingoeca rosetta (strain ATCC 50818 / BSB-021) TaxID=946362 RepID=F2USJ1_SALR5|nr:uncharacterized protein PTSG_11137 [Salpingoeca rosetta]EGD81100.1 hypothetical protein PTSG_11137 [Salpingoeca rosetta]|eukprot:XP_004987785.1 hypothetical protein PTSG_11137 [Salpingoeca rosetta]
MELAKRQQVKVVEAVASVLAGCDFVWVSQVVKTARVPIAKLIDKKTGTEVDVNCANVLGLVNTRLIRTYTKVDDRFRHLGFLVKLWAKACNLNDASMGTLSSYAWLIMTIHYLQRCDPPVLPNLQDRRIKGPPRRYHGFDCAYCSDLSKLQEVWKSRNTQSIGELYYGFFDYYCGFDFDRDIITCHTTKRKPKAAEKRWSRNYAARPMAIQDPIEKSHNLGKGISRLGVAVAHQHDRHAYDHHEFRHGRRTNHYERRNSRLKPLLDQFRHLD